MNECRERQSLGVGAKVLRTFVLGSESSRERKFQGVKVHGSESSWNIRSWVRKFQGTKVPGSEWNFRCRERKFLGAKVPVTPGGKSAMEGIKCANTCINPQSCMKICNRPSNCITELLSITSLLRLLGWLVGSSMFRSQNTNFQLVISQYCWNPLMSPV